MKVCHLGIFLMLLMRKKHTTGCHQRKDGKPYCDAEECQPQVMCREGRGLDLALGFATIQFRRKGYIQVDKYSQTENVEKARI